MAPCLSGWLMATLLVISSSFCSVASEEATTARGLLGMRHRECWNDYDCQNARKLGWHRYKELNGPCKKGVCKTRYGRCESEAKPANTVCRPAKAGCDCDKAETCDGYKECPADEYQPKGYECRASAGDCDAAETCSGDSAHCPADEYQPKGYECRASAGDCDAAETCSGDSADCPADEYQPKGYECRASAGDCDVAETCDGASKDCPSDKFKSKRTCCRPAGGVCDKPEFCTGYGPACPDDEKKGDNYLCRRAKDKCDVPEYCDGESNDCPADKKKEHCGHGCHAIGYKCGPDCYFCHSEKKMGRGDVTVSGRSCGMGGCSLGICRNIIFLDPQDPFCQGPVRVRGPNNMEVGTVIFAECGRNGRLKCIRKKTGPFHAALALPW